MNENEKVLTYEEAKELCGKAFDGGCLYGSESMRYGVNAVAYDWDHWLKDNKALFEPKPTIEDVLGEFAERVCNSGHQWGLDADEVIAKYAAKLRLADDGKEQ